MQKNLICFCFGYSEEDIHADVLEQGGTSSILDRIVSEKKKGACNCAYIHPEGR
jgi:hypothetical protein